MVKKSKKTSRCFDKLPVPPSSASTHCEHGTSSLIELFVLGIHALALLKCANLQESLQRQNLYFQTVETVYQFTEPLL